MYRMKHRMRLRGNLKTYLRWPLFFGILLILMTIQLFSVSVRSGVIGIGYTILYLMIAGLINFSGRRKLKKDLIEFATNYGEMQMRMMKTLTVPFAILSEDGHMLWGNDEFVSVIVNKKAARRNIANIFEEITLDSLPDTDEVKVVHVRTEDKYYRVVMRLVESDNAGDGDTVKTDINQLMDNSRLISVFLYDETDIMELEQKREAENLVVGLLYIDNYDEVMNSVEEVRQSLLVALVDRKINQYIAKADGIVKKTETDKYFIALKKQEFKRLEDDKFSLLEDVKTVNIGNQIPLTLSIGLGLSAGNYSQSYNYARVAIDLALARGGDQAVIKDCHGITYYGGKREMTAKNTRVKARVKAEALREYITVNDKIFVMGHTLTDVDSFGAAIGICRAANALGKKANVVINEVSASLRPLYNMYIDNPSYPDDLFLTSEQALNLADENSMVVVVDTNRPKMVECEELLYLAKTIVVLDHHRQSSDSIDKALLSYIEPYASSACEMVSEILQYIVDDIQIPNLEASSMYAGIMIDTNSFMNRTGVRTFEAAAFLRRSGADITLVRKMFRDDMEGYRAKAAIISNAEVYQKKFAIATGIDLQVESPTIIGAQAANELLNIVGIKASFVLTEYQGKIYISSRSIDEINVQLIMERVGGGGHLNVAGAQLTNCTIQEAKRMIQDTIDEMIKEGDIQE